MKYVIDLLTKDLIGWERCKEKSSELHKKGILFKEEHETHISNL